MSDPLCGPGPNLVIKPEGKLLAETKTVLGCVHGEVTETCKLFEHKIRRFVWIGLHECRGRNSCPRRQGNINNSSRGERQSSGHIVGIRWRELRPTGCRVVRNILVGDFQRYSWFGDLSRWFGRRDVRSCGNCELWLERRSRDRTGTPWQRARGRG
uniref:Uncharacterized protein n=1 Tax=Cacopsylla melanoneura TaxID=428564 RepID=A0A8D8LWR5_9HEMI